MKYSEIRQTRDIKIAKLSGPTHDPGGAGTYAINLNKIHLDTIGISLSSKQISLPAGKYFLSWSTGGIRCNWTYTFLYDVTNSADIAGTGSCTTYHNSGGGTFEDLMFQPGVILEFGRPNVIELRQWFNADPTGQSHTTSPGNYSIMMNILRYT